jgi:hypothetical protein
VHDPGSQAFDRRAMGSKTLIAPLYDADSTIAEPAGCGDTVTAGRRTRHACWPQQSELE